MVRRLLVALALLLPLGTGPACAAPAPVTALHQLFDRAWEQDLVDNPLAATYYGETRFNDRWPDLTRASLERSHGHDLEVLGELRRIRRSALVPAEQLSYDLFEREYEERNAEWPFHTEAYGISASGGVQTLSELTEIMPFETVADYEAWLKRLGSLPQFLDQTAALLRDSARDRRTQPRVLMERVVPQLAQQLVATPEDSPFYQPFRRFPERIPAAERERLAAAARAAIAGGVLPAYQRFDRFFREEYLPAATASASRTRRTVTPITATGSGITRPPASAPTRSTRSACGKSRATAPRCRRSWTRSGSRARCRSSSRSCAPTRSSTTRRQTSCTAPTS